MASAKFVSLLGQPGANRIWLVEAQAYVPAAGAVQTFHHCSPGTSAAFVTQPGDSPANQIYDPDVESIELVQDLFGPDGQIGGRSEPDELVVRLNNRDGRKDAYYTYDWREVRVLLLGDGMAYAEAGEIFRGNCLAIEQTEGEIVLTFRDRQDLLDKPLQSAFFAGTGGEEGGPDLKGLPKPVCLGVVRNIEPVYLGLLGGMPAWRFHDGPAAAYDSAVHRLLDGGVPLVYEAADPPAAGKWTLRASTGVVVFNGTPAKQITMDAKGDATGSYVDTVGGIVRRLVTKYGGLTDPAQIDTAAFTQLDTDLPGDAGHYVRGGGVAPVDPGAQSNSGQPSLLDVLDAICGPLHVTARFKVDQTFTVQQFKGPLGSPVLSLGENQIAPDMQKSASRVAAWRQTVGYRRCHTRQDAGQLTDAFANSVVNGGFDADANWNKGSGWTIGGGVASASAGSQSDLDQAQAGLVAGQTYAVTFDVTRSAGSLQLRVAGADLGAAIAATGSYRRDFAAASATPTIAFRKDASFAGTVDNVACVPTHLEFAGQDYRAAVAEDAAVKTAFLKAADERVDTVLDALADAQVEADRRLDLFKVRRDTFEPQCFIDPLAVDLGAEVHIAYPRHGLAAGRNFVVVGRRADLTAIRVAMTVWG